MDYPIPAGLHAIPDHLLDLRPDEEVDKDLMNPKPVSGEKNAWFFWHQGFSKMHPYTQRNIRAWHRRLSPHGWVVRVLDRVSGSPLNVANFLDVTDTNTFPEAFTNGSIGGDYAPQHTSDLVRFPLLIHYGGVYADAGMLQIGDLNRLWDETLGNPDSPYEVLSYNMGGVEERGLANYFLCSTRNSPFFLRAHKLLLKLWEGKTDTEGLHSHPLLQALPSMHTSIGNFEIREGDKVIGPEEVGKMLTDYIIQGHAITLVMGLVDKEDGWNGPEYVAKNMYLINYIEGSQLINDMTGWDGPKQFELMSLPVPRKGEEESADQKQAREIVEACLQRSFGFKLAHGLILRVLGPTLGSLWRKNDGSDNVPGTYAHWLRYGMIHWNQDHVPPPLDFKVIPAFKNGPLLREEY